MPEHKISDTPEKRLAAITEELHEMMDAPKPGKAKASV
jgi:hypothetical protein